MPQYPHGDVGGVAVGSFAAMADNRGFSLSRGVWAVAGTTGSIY